MNAEKRNAGPAAGVGDLLQRAARCYELAGWSGDACRLYTDLGEHRLAGHYHEQLGEWFRAASAYTRAGAWGEAARCYLRIERTGEAAECLLKAGEPLAAAWLWAGEPARTGRALTTIADYQARGGVEEMTLVLIEARCASGRKDAKAAARGVRRVLAELAGLEMSATDRRQLTAWAGLVSEAIARPDLVAELHALRYRCGLPDAGEEWEAWARRNFAGCGLTVPELDEMEQNFSSQESLNHDE